MAYFDISEEDLGSFNGQVAIITGASSGIGLATAQLFTSKGGKVIGVDLQDPPNNPDSSTKAFDAFHKADVTSWTELSNVFKKVYNTYERIDIVCANAGIAIKIDLLNLAQDDQGNLVEPNKQCLDINLISVFDTVALAIHYMQLQSPKGGNIVLTASCTGYQRFAGADYVSAKHGVIGLLRSLCLELNRAEIPIRINAVAPSWTLTGMMKPLSAEEFDKMGFRYQEPEAVARSILLLAQDKSRHGQSLYSSGGRYVEMEEPLQGSMLKAIDREGLAEGDEVGKIIARAMELASAEANGKA